MRFVLLFLLLPLFLEAGTHRFLLTPGLIEAWQEISRMRLKNGEQLLLSERKVRPDNILTDVFALQLDFQRALASGSPQDEQQFQQAKSRLQQQLTNLSATDPWQQWALGYSGLTSLMLRLRAGDQWQAALEMPKAYARIMSAHEQYPGFVPNQLTYGIMQVAVGSLPDQFSWILRVASLKANSRHGAASLMRVLQLPDSHPFAFLRADAAVLLSMAARAMQTDTAIKNQAIEVMKSLDKKNLMLTYTLAYLLMRDGKNEIAINVLENRPQSGDYADFPIINFILGEAYLRKGNAQAQFHYKRFIDQTKGSMYVADAHRKLGWIALMKGDTTEYKMQMQRCLKHKEANSERDIEARREAASPILPHPALVAARLRFDGGYYFQAHEILENAANLFSGNDNPHRLEFFYRRARVAEGLGYLDTALSLYAETYRIGLHSPEYYAANAALRSAEIAARMGNRKEAADWYNKCLMLKPEAYRNSIHAAAKAGLRQLGY